MTDLVWFDPEEPMTPVQREFLDALELRAARWTELGASADETMYEVRDGVLILGLDICDHVANRVLHTLRIDFEGHRVLCGPDPTYQFTDPLTPEDPEVSVLSGDHTPREFASFAADWMESELRRLVPSV